MDDPMGVKQLTLCDHNKENPTGNTTEWQTQTVDYTYSG